MSPPPLSWASVPRANLLAPVCTYSPHRRMPTGHWLLWCGAARVVLDAHANAGLLGPILACPAGNSLNPSTRRSTVALDAHANAGLLGPILVRNRAAPLAASDDSSSDDGAGGTGQQDIIAVFQASRVGVAGYGPQIINERGSP